MGWQVLTHLPARFFLMRATIECGFSLVKEFWPRHLHRAGEMFR